MPCLSAPQINAIPTIDAIGQYRLIPLSRSQLGAGLSQRWVGKTGKATEATTAAFILAHLFFFNMISPPFDQGPDGLVHQRHLPSPTGIVDN